MNSFQAYMCCELRIAVGIVEVNIDSYNDFNLIWQIKLKHPTLKIAVTIKDNSLILLFLKLVDET